MSDRHLGTRERVLEDLRTDPSGLNATEVHRRSSEFGYNELIERGRKGVWRILRDQFASIMVGILLLAAVISALLGDHVDALVILAIVLLNAALGFRQEYKAEQSLVALKRMAAPRVRVRREGHVAEISARDLVPGDIVLLEAGSQVPADGRLLESMNLRVQEAALTGESEPVEKDSEATFDTEQSLADRRNMAHMGTLVSYGHAEMVVTQTGMQTELGNVAAMLQRVEKEPTPLQRRLDRLGRVLAVAALVIVAIIFAVGLARGEELRLMFLTAVSLAVAAVPEGLPAVVTIALALGAQRMLKRHALIRKLTAVETLGSVTVICSDKTGTLTENRMKVTVLDVAGARIQLVRSPEQPAPELVAAEGGLPEAGTRPSLDLLLLAAAVCNDAVVERDEDGSLRGLGDPTETALVLAAERLGLSKSDLDDSFPRVAEAPFDSVRKRMTTVNACPGAEDQIPQSLLAVWARRQIGEPPSHVAFTKGALGSLIDLCTEVWVDGRREQLTPAWRDGIQTAHDELAAQGMRVLGVALRPLDAAPESADASPLERDLVFIGLIGLIDPPRPEVAAAVETCRAAGIRPVMITGDHPLTARHIAMQLGIATEDEFLTGRELDELSEEALGRVGGEVSVFARVSPEHKLRLIDALQAKGEIVAMTGDGVNDAPALKSADIGVAMGITGTDVAKEASDMVLQDDNFATIVAAVEEGRVIYDNIRKFIRYLLSCNSGELWVMLLAPLLGMPLALLPLQILWMNLVTDGLPALALALEPAERNTMRRPPYPPSERIFSRGMAPNVLITGFVMALVALGAGYLYWSRGAEQWQTMVFVILTLSQILFALAVRSRRDSLFKIGLWSNPAILGAVGLTFVLQLVVIYTPFLRGIFAIHPLSAKDLGVALALSTLVFWAIEIQKWWMRSRPEARDQ